MRKVFALFLSFVLFIPMISVAKADDVSMFDTVIDADIREDGTVTITENWTVDFKGHFTQFERRIPINTNETIEMESVTVNGKDSIQILDIDETRPEGYYAYRKSDNEAILNIYMNTYSERVTFQVTYTMTGTVHRYQDVAEFNFDMIGEEWELPMNHVSGTITFPSVESQFDDIHVWGHGPANGNVEIVGEESVYYECENLPKNTKLNIRLVLPSDMFKSLEMDTNAYLNDILEEEASYAKKEAKLQMYIRLGTYIGGGTSLIVSICGFLLVFMRRRKLLNQYQPSFEPEYYRDLPSKLSPSEVIDLLNYINKKYKDENKFASTLMSLSLYGLIEFEIYEENGFLKSKKKTKMIIHHDEKKVANLKNHEYVLYKFIKECSVNNEATMDDVHKTIKKHPQSSQRILERFKSGSTGLVEKAGYFDLRLKTSWMCMVGCMMMFISLGVFILIVATSSSFNVSVLIISLLPALSGIVCLLMGLTCKRYTQKGVDEVALWKAFENFLNEFTLMDEKELPELVMWEEYLVYAVALGIGEKVLKQLPIAYPDFYESDFYRYSYVRSFYYGGHPNLHVFDGVQSFSSHLDTAAHYHENSSGSGGSFSSGGGGGFAGGGSSSGGGGGSFS